ncbi:MAG TPA: hypothetical protein VK787_04725 [Puia sp.]|jgi:hypothetical protein|nr:hypothetical protein [Puia sp.]
MKKIFLSVITIVIFACNNNTSFKKAEDAEDAGREFIRASLDGNYDKARFYLYADSTNDFLFNRWKRDYDELSGDEKSKYKNSDIVVLNINRENDSVSTFKYFNSYKKDTTIVKILRIKNEWLVDLKEFMKIHK